MPQFPILVPPTAIRAPLSVGVALIVPPASLVIVTFSASISLIASSSFAHIVPLLVIVRFNDDWPLIALSPSPPSVVVFIVPEFVIVTPSSCCALTAFWSSKAIEPFESTVKESLSSQSNWEVVADEIVVSQAPANTGLLYKIKKLTNKKKNLNSI